MKKMRHGLSLDDMLWSVYMLGLIIIIIINAICNAQDPLNKAAASAFLALGRGNGQS